MSVEQLTKDFMDLKSQQTKNDLEIDNIKSVIQEIRDDGHICPVFDSLVKKKE